MSFGSQSPCDPQGHHAQLAVEVELEELRARSQRVVELIDARLKRTKNASGFIRRLRAVIEGASA